MGLPDRRLEVGTIKGPGVSLARGLISVGIPTAHLPAEGPWRALFCIRGPGVGLALLSSCLIERCGSDMPTTTGTA